MTVANVQGHGPSRVTRGLGLAGSIVIVVACSWFTARALAATSLPCADTATVSVPKDATGYIIKYGPDAPKGATFTGDTFKRADWYEVHKEAISLAFGETTYRLSQDAIVRLGCSGTSAGTAAKYPMLRMLQGQAIVSDAAKWFGSMQTEEGLFNPVLTNTKGMTFTVTRNLHQQAQLTFNQKFRWYANYSDQPTGTTVTSTTGSQLINVTPYVPPEAGSCRHVDHATLETTSSYGHGSATYPG